ncbi:uncharacterized protein LOC122858203 [Aphidius gifuensis]|uniref:uncharacterized protein LOC122858203 n=1 Tax=Aphidius gifuensis TaxID=684658 RepID=UPI001CDD7A07|nr:uncharacterized protein LOC122858203 [Aphidius gifuensis]
MTNMIMTIVLFFQYWYSRYLLVTELYMVEKWERILVNIFFVVSLTLILFFSYNVLFSTTNLSII